MTKTLKKAFGDTTTHYKATCIIEKFEVFAGLNLLSDFNGMNRHLQRLVASVFSFMAKSMEQKGNVSLSEINPSPDKQSVTSDAFILNRACFWDKYRFMYQGRSVVNIRNFNIGVLTGTVPYDRDHIKIGIEGFNILHFDSKIDVLLSNFTLKRIIYPLSSYDQSTEPKSVTTLMKIPLIETSFVLNWNASNDYLFFLRQRKTQIENAQNFIAKNLFIEVKCHFPKLVTETQKNRENKTVEELICRSSIPIMLYEANVYNELLNLPQLRHEYLLLHGIKPSSYNEEGSDADKAINQQKVAVFSNYMELLTYTLNQALNTKEENLVKFISQVSLSLHTTSIRMIATNRNMAFPVHKKINQDIDNKDDSSIVVGLQSIIESITYRSLFVKRTLKIQRLDTESVITEDHHDLLAPSRLVWQAENGRGQLDCFLAGFLYRNFKLINFDEAALLNYKREVWETSMENPDHFIKFFGLTQQDIGLFKSLKRLELFDHENLYLEANKVSSPLTDNSSEFMSPRLFKLCTTELFNFSKSIRPPLMKYKSDVLQDHPVHILNFDHHEVFFSTRVIIYELSKQRDLIQITGHDLNKEELIQASFDHFVTMFDSRICVVYSLFKVISEMLEVKQDKNVNKLKMKSKKKKHASEGAEKHVLKTEEEAKWNEIEGGKGSLKKRSLIDEKQFELNKEKVLQNTKVSYLFGVVIAKPQFNFNDYLNFNQTIFTSKEECFIYMQRECLQYDYFNMDPRITIRTIFKDLELFNSSLLSCSR